MAAAGTAGCAVREPRDDPDRDEDRGPDRLQPDGRRERVAGRLEQDVPAGVQDGGDEHEGDGEGRHAGSLLARAYGVLAARRCLPADVAPPHSERAERDPADGKGRAERHARPVELAEDRLPEMPLERQVEELRRTCRRSSR